MNQRLIEIVGCGNNKPFGGTSMILFGDIYQLPPVRARTIHMSNQSVKGYITLDLWEMFQFAEITEVMRQRGDNLLIRILKKILMSDVYKGVDAILNEQFITPDHLSFPTDALHFLAENKPSIDHIKPMLNKLQSTSLGINV